MKKLGLLFKEISENQIKIRLKESDNLFIIKYSKLSSPELTLLRQSLKDINASFFVIKNTVARRALKNSGLESAVKTIEGPCGLVFVKEEPVSASRILFNFSREHAALKLEAGFLKDKVLNPKDIEALSKLPTKEVLRQQVVYALKSPIFGLISVLKGNLRKLVYCLDQIRTKKGESHG